MSDLKINAITESNLAEQIITEKDDNVQDDYKKLNDKCDKIISKIKDRKNKKELKA